MVGVPKIMFESMGIRYSKIPRTAGELPTCAVPSA
jgi:hypothetical protein